MCGTELYIESWDESRYALGAVGRSSEFLDSAYPSQLSLYSGKSRSTLRALEHHCCHCTILIWLFYFSKRMESTLAIIPLVMISATLERSCDAGFVLGTFCTTAHLRFRINMLGWYYYYYYFIEKKMKFWDISTRAKVSTHISLGIKRLVFPIYFSRHLKMRKEKQNSDMPCCFIIINL